MPPSHPESLMGEASYRQTRGTFDFASLPPELRLLVYRQLTPCAVVQAGLKCTQKKTGLKCTGRKIKFASNYSIGADNTNGLCVCSTCVRRSKQPSSSRHLMRLLLVCKFINRELTAELYERTHFKLYLEWSHFSSGSALLSRLSKWTHLRHVHFRLLGRCYMSAFLRRMRLLVLGWPCLADLLISFGRLHRNFAAGAHMQRYGLQNPNGFFDGHEKASIGFTSSDGWSVLEIVGCHKTVFRIDLAKLRTNPRPTAVCSSVAKQL